MRSPIRAWREWQMDRFIRAVPPPPPVQQGRQLADETEAWLRCESPRRSYWAVLRGWSR